MKAHTTLLVVDDAEMNRDMLSRRLRREGYTVLVAGSGREALEIIDRQQVTLLLLDVEMPEMSGLEVLSTVRARYSRSELPIIMLLALRIEARELSAIGERRCLPCHLMHSSIRRSAPRTISRTRSTTTFIGLSYFANHASTSLLRSIVASACAARRLVLRPGPSRDAPAAAAFLQRHRQERSDFLHCLSVLLV